MRMEVVQCDITQMAADAIVNAANTSLLGGGGVDGAIHRRAGPRLLDACRKLPEVRTGVRCPTGEARATPGFDLPVRFVIHTAGPVWNGGTHGEPELLAACHRNSLALARTLSVERIVFPAISCGVYGYPARQAARVATATVRDELARHRHPAHVVFCCFGESMATIFQNALDAVDDLP
ncbi:MAG TPA: O-acetyl-ADP-ribose deacetylase [Oleiagrimonas sp.]|nr:O-acetyl-ADP-ribose deacetylase [Oleiagrimonas sp.]